MNHAAEERNERSRSFHCPPFFDEDQGGPPMEGQYLAVFGHSSKRVVRIDDFLCFR